MRTSRRTARLAVFALAGAIVVAPPAALAVFSASPVVTAGVTAATISAPGSFTATAASGTTASLSWTAPAPPAPTGYTLAQAPGTLAGCSATPSGTSCTATGLTSGTPYTWTLKAAYNNWLSSSVTASATTTSASVGFTLLGNATDGTSGTSASTVTDSKTGASGAVVIILIYRQASSNHPAVSSITGTAISGTPAAINSQSFGSPPKYVVSAYSATGSGTTNGTVTVTFDTTNNVNTTIDVVGLSGYNTSSPIAGSAVSSSSGTTATGSALTPGNSSDGELFFAGLTSATSMTTPTGYTALDVPASTVHGSWYSTSASATGISATLGVSSTGATIEIEIAHS
ncbi:MAG TPA: fibronectin type III domain-containing protein [Trebonia sp.]|jgi:hypothetical protein|nr:fibronectin type III domain-containing protein [Trebonia sp.]